MELNTLWIARDEDGSLYMYWSMPQKDSNPPKSFYDTDGRAERLNSDLYPEVTFENSPQRLISHQSIFQTNGNHSCFLNAEVVFSGVPKGFTPRFINANRHY